MFVDGCWVSYNCNIVKFNKGRSLKCDFEWSSQNFRT